MWTREKVRCIVLQVLPGNIIFLKNQVLPSFTPPAVPLVSFTQLAHIWKFKRTCLKLPFGDFWDILAIKFSIRVWACLVVLWALCVWGLFFLNLDPMLTWNAVKIISVIFSGHLLKIRGWSRRAAVLSEGSDMRSSSCGWINYYSVCTVLLHLWAAKHAITDQETTDLGVVWIHIFICNIPQL